MDQYLINDNQSHLMLHCIPLLANSPFHCSMQVLSSLKEAKQRRRDCQVVTRRGRIYVICKSNPRFKVRQGGAKNQRSK